MVCGNDGLCRSELGVRCGPLVSGPDAKLSGPDAVLSGPDAQVSEPDAPVSEPDAAVPEPDAAAPEPDAAVPPPCTTEVVTVDDFPTGRKILDIRLGIAPDGHMHVTYATGTLPPQMLVHSDLPPDSDVWDTRELYQTQDLLIGQQVDAKGQVHVSYVEPPGSTGALRYARRDANGLWSTTVVRGPSNWNSSLALGADGAINILAHATGGYIRARRDPDQTDWDLDEVDGGYNAGQGAAAVLTPDGTLATAYRRLQESNPNFSNLRLGRQGLDGWDVTPLDSSGDTGHYPAMAVDAAGDLHIVYGDFTAKVLRYLVVPKVGAPSSRVIVDDGSELGRYNSIAFDHEGNLHVTSLDLAGGRLRHAVQRPEARTFAVRTVEMTGRIEGRSSIAVAPDGRVFVAFPNALMGHARVARLCP